MKSKISESYDLRILRSLRCVIRAVDKYSHKLNTELGLTTPQLLCLDTLAKNERPLTLTELAETVNLGASTVNGIVDRLERDGLVHRIRSQEDRRVVVVALRPEAGQQIQRWAQAYAHQLFAGSTEEELDLAVAGLSCLRDALARNGLGQEGQHDTPPPMVAAE